MSILQLGVLRAAGVAFFAFTVVGCTTWPTHGQGGTAEHYPPVDFYQPAANAKLDEAVLLQQLEMLHTQLDVLSVQGAMGCMPATVKTNVLLSDRIRREIAGGLLKDAAHNLVVLQHDLRDFRQRFYYIASQTQCLTVADASTEKPQPYAFMNSFFFDVGSAELAPVYIEQLSWLVAQVSADVQWQVRAYSDSSGEINANTQLSAQRAQAVVSSLIELGINAQHIESTFSGELAPILRNNDAFSLGMNRRVDVFVSTPTQKQVTDVTKVGQVKNWEYVPVQAAPSAIKAW